VLDWGPQTFRILKFVGSFGLDSFLEGRILDPCYEIVVTSLSVIWGLRPGCLRLKGYNE
jgi:hypothetical protein